MRTYVSDTFDLKLSIRGLAHQIMYTYSDLYEYAYYFTFKRGVKVYEHKFQDPFDSHLMDDEFLSNSSNPLVRNCYRVIKRLSDCRNELIFNWGIDEEEDLANKIIHQQAMRYNPYKLNYKVGKSYKRLQLFYERTLAENIAYYYLFASAITAQNYRIPEVFRKQFELPVPECLRLLNQDDHNVFLLAKLICGLNDDLNELKLVERRKLLKRTSKTLNIQV